MSRAACLQLWHWPFYLPCAAARSRWPRYVNCLYPGSTRAGMPSCCASLALYSTKSTPLSTDLMLTHSGEYVQAIMGAGPCCGGWSTHFWWRIDWPSMVHAFFLVISRSYLGCSLLIEHRDCNSFLQQIADSNHVSRCPACSRTFAPQNMK